MAPTLFRLIAREETRDGNSFESSSGLSRSRLYIIIFSAAGALLLGVILWFTIRTLRRRMQGKNYSRRNAPLISVQGDGEKIEYPATRDRKPSLPESVICILYFSSSYLLTRIIDPWCHLPKDHHCH